MKKFRFWMIKNSMLLGNLMASLIGVMIIDLLSRQSIAPPTQEVMHLASLIDRLYMPLSFTAIGAAVLIYEHPIRHVLNNKFQNKQPCNEEVWETARRRLLNEPFVLISFNLAAWFLAAIVYPVVFYLNGINYRIIVRTFFQTSLLGIVTAICAFFVLERILQKWMVPIFFPAGGLYRTPKTFRIRIRTRLIALLFVCNLIPFFAVLMILSGTYTLNGDPAAILDLLRPTFLINSFIFMSVALIVTLLVGKNLAQPFSEIIRVLKNIRNGNLDKAVRVTTNDEIGYTGDVINEMTEGLKERKAMRHSLELAREVQQNLLPDTFPGTRGLDIAGRSIYCDQTGGDYFDYLELNGSNQRRMGVVVGDVSGHGVPSALLMATARAFLRLRASMPGNIGQVLTDVNRLLIRDVGDSGRFMTLFYLVIDPEEKSLKWVRAGHDAAILYNPENDSFEALYGRGIALGVDENWEYEENKKAGFSDGQIILIGTDGIWEARNARNEMFGKERLYEIIRQNAAASASEIVENVIASLDQFMQDHKAEDDITLMAIKTSEGRN